MDIANIRLSACAYFYKLKNGESISLSDAKTMLQQVTADKVSPFALNLLRQIGLNGSHFSIRVFKNSPSKPSFFNMPEKGWYEQKVGYFLFIEYGRYVAVLRRYCTLPKAISDKLEGIDYSYLVGLHSQNDTVYQKVSMQNLDGSDYAVRNKSYESLDLKNNITAIGANRYYVRTVKGNNGDDRFALTLYSSRINEFDAGMTISDVCGWVTNVIDRINGLGAVTGDFLSMFAKPEKYSDLCHTLEPKTLLVYYSLLAHINDEQHAVFTYTHEDGSSKTLDGNVVQRYLELISRAFVSVHTIDEGGKIRYFAGHDNDIEIVLRKNDIRLTSKKWKKIEISNTDEGEYDGTLEELINKNSQFSVYFSVTTLVYSNRKLFRDAKLLDSIPQLIKVLKEWTELNDTEYEKYPNGTEIATLTSWGQKSIFKVVEDKLPTLGYQQVICDDCKTEWADHIAIKQDAVCFLAEKWKDSTNSASDFQDVVGQALKNLGNLTPSPTSLTAKEGEWKKLYLTSVMPRYRSIGGTVEGALKI